jgi:nitrogen regulatory protein P-II 1
MKKIEAIIRVEKFEAVKEALDSCNCPGVTTTAVEGHGRQKGLEEQFRGTTFRVEFIPKLKLEIIVSEDNVDKIVDAIMENAMTGEIGDGKIFILPVNDAIRIRTKERGDKAL